MGKSNLNIINIHRFKNMESLPDIQHFVSTRKGGVSEIPFNELNVALQTGDRKEHVLKNRRVLAKMLGVRPGDFVYLGQTHSSRAKIVIGKHRGRGAQEDVKAISDFDALITKTPGIYLIVQVADCVPVLLFDPNRKIVAAIHAGWRGTMKEIVKKTVDRMKKEFDCDPKDMISGIGPSIGPCCFEVRKNVFHLANIIYSAKEAVVIKKRRKTFVDLWQANKLQLLRAGLLEKNIEVSGICTACNTDEFFSARKEGKTGRIACGIMLCK